MIGGQLEEAHRIQVSFVKPSDSEYILNRSKICHEAEIALLLASQSCDIANNSIE